MKEGWADAGARRDHGRQRGRDDRAARRRAASRSRAGGRRAVSGVRPRRPRRDDAPLRVALHLRLVGPLPAAADVYRDRSPVSHAAEIRAPVLLLHGDKDTSVPLAQSEAIADALRAAGTPVERHVYEGEGHGWRQAGDDRRRLRTRRRVPDALGAPALSASAVRDGYPGSEARRRPRGAARARRGRRHERGRADDGRRRARRRADPVAALRLSVPARGPARARSSAGARRRRARGRGRARAAQRSVPLDRLVLGGRSMGGRICSLVAGDEADPVPALGLALLGYPLHPPGKPETLRVEHFKRLTMPVLFASGTRDAFGTPAELKRHAKKVKGPVTFSLGRDRRPRLQATEGERPDAPPTRCRASPRRSWRFVQSLDVSRDARMAAVRVERWFAFVDLSGFTSFGDEFGDEESVRVLTLFRSAVRKVATDFGVRIAKWLGDGCMLVSVEPAPARRRGVRARAADARARAPARDARRDGRRRGDPARR